MVYIMQNANASFDLHEKDPTRTNSEPKVDDHS